MCKIYLSCFDIALIIILWLQCDLLDLPAVAQLEKDAKYAPVYQLLKIFLTQRLNAYSEFKATNSECLQSYGTILYIHQMFFLNTISGGPLSFVYLPVS